MTFYSGLVDTHDLFKGSSVRFILNLLRTHLGTISFSHLIQKHGPIAPYYADNVRKKVVILFCENNEVLSTFV